MGNACVRESGECVCEGEWGMRVGSIVRGMCVSRKQCSSLIVCLYMNIEITKTFRSSELSL